MLNQVQTENLRFFVPAVCFVSMAFLMGSTRLIKYFPDTSKEGLFLSAALGGTLVAGTGYVRQRGFLEYKFDLNKQIYCVASLAVSAIIAPYIAKSLMRMPKLSLKASCYFAIVEMVVVIGIDFFSQPDRSSLLDEKKIIKYLTVGDGNCLIHALYGDFDSAREIRLKSADECRANLAHEIFALGDTIQRLKSFVGNKVVEENINSNNLGLSMKENKKYLGLEHAHMIAQLHQCNILVYNERTHEKVLLFYNPNSEDPDYFISYNGINHWSKCEFDKKKER